MVINIILTYFFKQDKISDKPNDDDSIKLFTGKNFFFFNI